MQELRWAEVKRPVRPHYCLPHQLQVAVEREVGWLLKTLGLAAKIVG